MNKSELLTRLINLQSSADIENSHGEADDLLIDFIDDPEIKTEYEKIHKWYA